MPYIEPHAHMVSRTTDDYERLHLAGCRVVCEPAFWAGFDRSSADGFNDYFEQITRFEPKRAAAYGIAHYAWICLNPKEAEDLSLAREVLSIIPAFLDRSNVLGIGEIGLNKNSRNELAVLHEHLALAVRHRQLVLVHTPHLEDKRKGTQLILDAIREHPDLPPERVLIDHVEEHTVRLALDRGHWAGITLYPTSKCSVARAIDLLDVHGLERLWLNSACDWGVSDPLAVPQAMREMRRRGRSEDEIATITWHHPARFLSQSPRFHLPT